MRLRSAFVPLLVAPMVALTMAPAAVSSAERPRVARPSTSPATPPRVVHTVTDHELYIESHRIRIARIADAIVRENRERYGDVDAAELHRAAMSHDAMKLVRDAAVYRKYGFAEPPGETLVKYWGKPLSSSDGPLGTEGGQFIRRLTAADHELEKSFAPKVREIVNLADKIDKGTDPVPRFEELGRHVVPASEYLGNPRHRDYDPSTNPILAAIAKRIESRIEVIIPHHLRTPEYLARHKAQAGRYGGAELK